MDVDGFSTYLHRVQAFLPAQTDIITWIYTTKCFFEAILASSEGLAYRVNSSRIQDSFWYKLTEGSLPASLHLYRARRPRASPSEFVLLHLLMNELSPDSIFASCQIRLPLSCFTPFSFPQLPKVILQAVGEVKRKDAKRREGEMKNENGRLLGKEVQTNQGEYFFNWDTDSPVNFV